LAERLEAVIFDLGGVIINIEPQRAFQAFARLLNITAKEVSEIAHKSGVIRDFEKGLIEESEFYDAVRELFNQSLTDQEIANAWNQLLLDIPTERLTLLDNVKQQYNTLLLSNTNPIHIREVSERIPGSMLGDYFHKVYLSHEIKMLKPAPEIFEYVLKENKLEPANTFFIDDNPANVQSAASLNIQTLHVEAFDQVIQFFNNR